ncbi:hypothetical protein PS681_05856 [Pseudomonas fluorescens]|nr:hypothetical protein PS681_05856 [Pseudomonas fluorescens]
MIAINANRLVHETRGEVRGEGVRQTALTSQLRTEQAGTKQPDRHVGAGARHGYHALIRGTRAEVAHQFGDIFREIISAAGAFTAQRPSRHLIGTRCTAQTEIDPPRIQAFQGAELLSDHQRRMVGQHHAAGADADGRRPARQITQQHRGGGTGNAIHVVVFSYPKPRVAEFLDMLCQIQ